MRPSCTPIQKNRWNYSFTYYTRRQNKHTLNPVCSWRDVMHAAIDRPLPVSQLCLPLRLRVCYKQHLDHVWVVNSALATLISSCFPLIVGFTRSVEVMWQTFCLSKTVSSACPPVFCAQALLSVSCLSVCVCVCSTHLMKLGMSVVPLEVSSHLYLLIFCYWCCKHGTCVNFWHVKGLWNLVCLLKWCFFTLQSCIYSLDIVETRNEYRTFGEACWN